MNINEFNDKKKFSEASGIISLIDSRISLRLNKYGLYEESIDSADYEELDPKCINVTPYLNSSLNEGDISEELFSNNEEVQYDNRLGYFCGLYVGHVFEGDYRKNASSGGVGTWILKELLAQKLVDGVIHVKENEDKSSPILFSYQISRNLKEVKEGAKTKYYPVELSEILKTVKNEKGKFAIVGIPSFIMAIRLLAKEEPIFSDKIAYTIGLICGHQKSSKFAEYMAWQVGIKPGNLKHIDFRYKIDGLRADKYAIKMEGLINGEEKTIIKLKDELGGQNWGLGYFKPLASDYTDDVFNETADIVVGDAWLPEYTGDSLGNNILIVRNQLLNSLIEKSIESGVLKLDKVNSEKIFQSQAAHYRHTKEELPYRIYNKKNGNRWYPKLRVEPSNSLPITRKLVQRIRIIISEKSHLYYKVAVEKGDVGYFERKMRFYELIYNFVYLLMGIQNKGLIGTLKYFKCRLTRSKS
ncbi:Coenzyme F420 hydrogenase/dehydrogenase, beta subunit C-terminal domain [Pseudoalteromonas piscicida]|uniref:Coenzyme F420 hydrogenase n=1 Tax=Pseudoalteromonas piscicida TaxID=43662 RepID=A0ABM6NJ01_PSEO7|nr:Coenzyme F420 hydrogenase/dehydrogenase, beta subunit C-terminal domain [Pseudoalteromonas piscicida]ATD08969.1 hypothetical protein PPIS_a4326 [Pseudoalteromonas piscicida]WPU30944.1 Coenzyme F420 hydrogenase/dehydrogenase, beta subunit C-terminal domain [Pseudoalteromonas piscicida]